MMIKGKQTFRGIQERAKADVLKAAARVRDPEGDVEPVAYLYVPSVPSLHVHDIPRHAFANDDTKEQMIDMIKFLIAQGPATMMAMSVTVYSSAAMGDAIKEAGGEITIENGRVYSNVTGLYAGDMPDAKELVMLNIFDAEIVKTWWCPIARSKGRPKYGPWVDMSGTDYIGRMVVSFQEALR